MTSTEIAQACDCERTQVRNIVIQYRGDQVKEEFIKRTKQKQEKKYGKRVYCVELNETFSSIAKAGERMFELGKCTSVNAGRTGVGRACNNKRSMVYGMHFQFV